MDSHQSVPAAPAANDSNNTQVQAESHSAGRTLRRTKRRRSPDARTTVVMPKCPGLPDPSFFIETPFDRLMDAMDALRAIRVEESAKLDAWLRCSTLNEEEAERRSKLERELDDLMEKSRQAFKLVFRMIQEVRLDRIRRYGVHND